MEELLRDDLRKYNQRIRLYGTNNPNEIVFDADEPVTPPKDPDYYCTKCHWLGNNPSYSVAREVVRQYEGERTLHHGSIGAEGHYTQDGGFLLKFVSRVVHLCPRCFFTVRPATRHDALNSTLADIGRGL